MPRPRSGVLCPLTLGGEIMTVLIYVALGVFVVLLFLWDLGFDSVVARVGRGVLKLISFGRFQSDDTGDTADIVVGAITIVAFFLLLVLVSSIL